MKKHPPLFVWLLVGVTLLACGLTESALDAQTTEIAAEIFATQTASVSLPADTPAPQSANTEAPPTEAGEVISPTETPLPAVLDTDISGSYDISGTSQDGSSYGGTVIITKVSETEFSIEWRIGGSTLEGVGEFINDTFVVDDGTFLNVYTVLPDGVLDGTWSQLGVEGMGTEVLTPIDTPVASQPTVESQPTCNGWIMHLVGLDEAEDDMNIGWKYVTAVVALENISAVEVGENFAGRALKETLTDLTLTTTEGFTYPIYNWGASGIWLPPEFRFTGGLGLIFRAAQTTTPLVIETSCGTLDFEHLERDLVYPTDLPVSSFLSLDTPIEFPEGVLTFTFINTGGDDPECRSQEDVTCLHYTFVNASAGFNAILELKAEIVGADGIVHENWSRRFMIWAGPGMTIEDTLQFSTTSLQNRKLLITHSSEYNVELGETIQNQDYWIFNID